MAKKKGEGTMTYYLIGVFDDDGDDGVGNDEIFRLDAAMH